MENPILPWYIAGPLIGLIVPTLLILRERQFGLSSNYKYILSFFASKRENHNYNRTLDQWQFELFIGIFLAGILSHFILPEIQTNQTAYGIIAHDIYNFKNAVYFLVSGIFVGFGARYANGCTAGHCIMGISQGAPASMISTIAFFIGGLLVSYLVIPFIF